MKEPEWHEVLEPREAVFDHLERSDAEYDVAFQLRFLCDQIADHVGAHHLLVNGVGLDMLSVERLARFRGIHPLQCLRQPSRARWYWCWTMFTSCAIHAVSSPSVVIRAT